MNNTQFALAACLFGLFGCGGGDGGTKNLSRSSAMKIISNSSEFADFKDIPSMNVREKVIVGIERQPGMLSNCGTDNMVFDARHYLTVLQQAEDYGLLVMREVVEPKRNCSSTFKVGALTDKGSAISMDTYQGSFQFKAAHVRIEEIEGIRMSPGENDALVLFSVAIDKKADNFENLLADDALMNKVDRGYSARMALYDDGWRVESISSVR